MRFVAFFRFQLNFVIMVNRQISKNCAFGHIEVMVAAQVPCKNEKASIMMNGGVYYFELLNHRDVVLSPLTDQVLLSVWVLFRFSFTLFQLVIRNWFGLMRQPYCSETRLAEV